MPAEVTDEMVEAALRARVPGGAEVWAWLPQKDAFTPHQTARDVMRSALEAVAGGIFEAGRKDCEIEMEAAGFRQP